MSMRAPLLLLAAMLSIHGAGLEPEPEIARVTAGLNGVFSPRGYFNITVRLYQLDGVEWAKYDLKKSRITLDFRPGSEVTAEDIRRVMREAGYKPGPVEIRRVRAVDAQAGRGAPGWVRIKRPTAKNAVVRWFQLNF